MMRHKLHFLLYAGLMALAGHGAGAERVVVPLADGWRLQSSAVDASTGAALSQPGYAAQGWYLTRVPSTVLAALVDSGVYPDPYYGLNLKSIPGYKDGLWLVMPQDSPFRPAWWYRTEFTLDAAHQGKTITLHFDGINYQANIWLNGEQIADSQSVIGMFRRFEFDVTGKVKFGAPNALAVEIIPPGLIEDKEYRTKQIEATTGWDDHNPQPPDLNMGIWEDVYLSVTGPVRLKHPYVLTDLVVPALDEARLTVFAELVNTRDEPVSFKLEGRIEDIVFEQEIDLPAGRTRTVYFSPREFPQLIVKNPRVWWPVNLGKQELYEMDLRLLVNGEVSDAAHVRFGIRKAETYINDEGWRGYKINGRNVLIRGGAWMTCDMLLRLTPKRYDALIRYAREGNLNMLRSEGFSIRETEEFYNLCDEYGVMVTQQIFGRNIPDEPLAIACIEDMMLRIRNHPSLVHFLGHDETFPTETLDKAYKELLTKHHLSRSYQPHSGAFDVEERFQTGGTRTGTRELWTYANPAHYYVNKEDGAWGFAQSGGIGGIIAPIESVRAMIPADQLWPLWTEAWSFHTVTQGGPYFDAALQAMNRRYGAPSSVEEFCLKGQVMNYESARGMFEAYGRNKYDALGITTWKYDAAWPAAMTWQYVDYFLRAGGAYYGAKKACEPLHVQYSYDDHSVWVVNTFSEPFQNLQVTAKVYNFDLTEKANWGRTVSVEPDGKTQAFVIQWPEGLSATFFLSLRLTDMLGKEISSNFYWLSTTPDIEGEKGYEPGTRTFFVRPQSTMDLNLLNTLPETAVKIESAFETQGNETVAAAHVTNAGGHLAFAVRLMLTKGVGGEEVCPTFWQDNYVCLMPGESRALTGRVYTADLGGAQPAIRVDGWNVGGAK